MQGVQDCPRDVTLLGTGPAFSPHNRSFRKDHGRRRYDRNPAQTALCSTPSTACHTETGRSTRLTYKINEAWTCTGESATPTPSARPSSTSGRQRSHGFTFDFRNGVPQSTPESTGDGDAEMPLGWASNNRY